jgi:cellulose synthase/poly-beta-1,6-N-acetylglucosamine synthase-like glycosyltransferase
MNQGMSSSLSDWAVGVVVPACDEEQSVEACLDSIMESLQGSPPARSAWIVLVADSCQDRTVKLARARLRGSGSVVECSAASPGVARRLGAQRLLQHFRGHSLERLWIANTDADSRPGRDWIHHQLSLAEQGYCGVAGIVRVESIGQLPAEVVGKLCEDYVLHPDGTHPHVHGANLGIRADAYIDAGGWSDLRLSEDHCLWSRVRAKQWRVASSIGSVVTTSGRLTGRAIGGFADNLRRKLELLYA